MKNFYIFAFLSLFTTAAVKSQVSLIKQLNMYQYVANLNGKLLFFANDGTDANYELWISDGTATGTQQVKDINGTSDGSILQQGSWIRGGQAYKPFLYKGYLYFMASGPLDCPSLWRSDGTFAGTQKFAPGMVFTNCDQTNPFFAVVNGELFFTESTDAGGSELYKTDGTDVGTTKVKDLSTYYLGSRPSQLTAFKDACYFIANDDQVGVELFKSDGTYQGTNVVKDIFPGPTGSLNDGYGGAIGAQLTVSGNYLYYLARFDSTNYTRLGLYRTDGTEGGTMLLSDHLSAQELTDVNGTLFFYADDLNDINGSGLYTSDGTVAGTVKVPLPGNQVFYPTYQFQKSFYAFNNKLYFPSNLSNGNQVLSYGEWVSDGTAAGTSLVVPMGLPSSGIESNEYNRDSVNNSFFYECVIQVHASSYDRRLFQTNGTTGGYKTYWGVSAYPGYTFFNGDVVFPGRDTVTTKMGLYKLTPSLGTPLPVTWLSFDATLTSSATVKLDWQTAVEENNKGFSVERSTDGLSYTSLSWVAGAGNSATAHTYSWTDDHPSGGKIYYRIQQVDLDGKGSYSSVRTINLSVNQLLSVSPNPLTGNTLTIRHSLPAGPAHIQITDLSGRQVLAKEVVLSGNTLFCVVGSLNAGVYSMTLTKEGQPAETKLFVKE